RFGFFAAAIETSLGPFGSTANNLFVSDASKNTGAVVSGGMASNAPASHAGPSGRGTPRWSVAAHAGPTGTRLIAGLAAPIACVLVGPPLSASAATTPAWLSVIVTCRRVSVSPQVPPAVASRPTRAALARAAGAPVGDAGEAAVAAYAARPAAARPAAAGVIAGHRHVHGVEAAGVGDSTALPSVASRAARPLAAGTPRRSEEHTSELQSRGHLVC